MSQPIFHIRPFEPTDYARVREIYGQGIAGGNATFNTENKDWPDWDRSFLKDCRLVLTEQGVVRGWAAISAFSNMPAYRGVAEDTLYIDENCHGRGAGRQLLDALVTATEQAGYWTLLAKIFPENEASLRLHERCGFRRVGMLERVACHHGRWRDVVVLQRRSSVVDPA
tara:strand:- start:16315 stop:16821 length:507 start_codon:yes stop_codon:yes gene_type:complete